MEGVIRLTKLHGSLDWFFNKDERRIYRKGYVLYEGVHYS
jgi:hypothetical protein